MMNLNYKVNHYLNDHGVWNQPAIGLDFPGFEAEAILNIPLNRRGGDDIRYWIGSKDGKY